jgi:hypothetical protein
VKTELVHVSLSERPDSPDKQKLLAIPTGLTLQRSDVDLLVQAGHDTIMNSTELRQFLDSYPTAPSRPSASRRNGFIGE